jgi:hypothetical protein
MNGIQIDQDLEIWFGRWRTSRKSLKSDEFSKADKSEAVQTSSRRFPIDSQASTLIFPA